MYCNVCKQKYDDYREVQLYIIQHILLEKHKKKIRGSTFNQYILELEEKYTSIRSNYKLKEKELTTQASNLIIIDESSVEEIELSKTRKKVKTDPDMDQEKTLLYENVNYSNRIPYNCRYNQNIIQHNHPSGYYWNMFSLPFTIQYPVLYP